jgi:hypothetical protein
MKRHHHSQPANPNSKFCSTILNNYNIKYNSVHTSVVDSDEEDNDDIKQMSGIVASGSRSTILSQTAIDNDKPRRIIKRWTHEETKALADGIKKHGKGKWQQILDDEAFARILQNRTSHQLRSKYNNNMILSTNDP